MQAYSDPNRESDPHALPDVELFEWPDAVRVDAGHEAELFESVDAQSALEAIRGGLCSGETVELEPCGGWYWRTCLPGCLPDSEPCGPFDTEAEALADARNGY